MLNKILSFIVILLVLTTQLFAGQEFKNKAEIRSMTRNDVSQAILDKTKNKSEHSFKNKKLTQEKYYRNNFSFSDFQNTDIRGVTFEECNFSFSINLDKATVDESTNFVRCNLTCADLPALDKLKKCNKRRFTDAEVEKHFKVEKGLTS